jgi:hypothetical protein
MLGRWRLGSRVARTTGTAGTLDAQFYQVERARDLAWETCVAEYLAVNPSPAHGPVPGELPGRLGRRTHLVVQKASRVNTARGGHRVVEKGRYRAPSRGGHRSGRPENY